MGLFNLFSSAKTIMVVDAVSLSESAGMKGKVPPRNQLQILRRLSRFSQREKVAVVAVLTGAPLNKAPAGKKFEGITVIYSKSPDVHAKFLAKTVAGKGANAVLVSGTAATEKVAANGVKKMRISTFRKAFDIGGENEGGERGENSRGRNNNNNNNRPPRRRQQKPSGNAKPNGKKNNNNASTTSNEPRRERPPKENSEVDAINELIDLVD